MLGGENKEIRYAADKCLMEFLKEIKAQRDETPPELDIKIINILVPVCKIKQTYTKYIALCWVYEYLKLKHQEFKEKK